MLQLKTLPPPSNPPDKTKQNKTKNKTTPINQTPLSPENPNVKPSQTNQPSNQPNKSILFYSRLCPSTAGSSPPPESSTLLCPLLSLSRPLPVVPQCHLSNDVLFLRLILRPLSTTLLIVHLSCVQPISNLHGYILD